MSELPFDYGAIDPLATELRYTSLATIKARLGIPATDTSRDTLITEAGVSAEYAIDVELGRSFPDGPGVPDESQPGPIQGIPLAVITAATQTAIAVWKEADAPVGSAGSDDFFGAIDVADIARRIVTRSVVLRGFKVGQAYGVA